MRLRLWEVPLYKALTILLISAGGGDAELDWRYEGGITTVSTKQDLARTVLRLYDVRKLIEDMRRAYWRGPADAEGAPAPATAPNGDREEEVPNRYELDEELIQLITKTVDADSWRDAGGSDGAVRMVSGRMVITHTPRAHKEIERLLARLREEYAKP